MNIFSNIYNSSFPPELVNKKQIKYYENSDVKKIKSRLDVLLTLYKVNESYTDKCSNTKLMDDGTAFYSL